jgi:4-diphosphocytidyl-2-C-methyl-D-erythritol kinase
VTPRAVRVAAQAKLNLALRIVGRAPDGYHELETLFQRIALADDVIVRLASTRTLESVGADVGPVEQNLAWRAAMAFVEAAGWETGFAISISKHIPVGGGMGGGSADAAAVLRAFNAMAPAPLSDERLAAVALTLGADVPFLVSPFALALGRGRGERLTPMAPLATRRVVLVRPPFGISSAAAFGWFARRAAGTYAAPSLDAATLRTWEQVASVAKNDLEGPVFAAKPQLESVLRGLHRSGAPIVRMTGSGSTLFALGAPRGAADIVLPDGWTLDETVTVEQAAEPEPIG